MFNCGILAVELAPVDIERLFGMKGDITIDVDLENGEIIATGSDETVRCTFTLNPFDRELVAAGGWLNYADQHY